MPGIVFVYVQGRLVGAGLDQGSGGQMRNKCS